MTPYYADDLVTIYHGDALEAAAVGAVDCVVTSPPYNTLGDRIPTRPTGMHSRSGWLRKVSAVGYADDMDEAEYAEWQVAVSAALASAAVPGASWFYNHKPRLRDKRVLHPLELVRLFVGWRHRPLRAADAGGAPGGAVIRLCGTGVRHRVAGVSEYPGDDARVLRTRCGLRVTFGYCGRLAKPSTDCRRCVA